jgi:hypothetical protein
MCEIETTSAPRHLDLVWVKGNTWTRIAKMAEGQLASIQGFRLLVIACVLFGTLSARAALAENIVVGVNVVGPEQLTAEQQAALIAELRSAGVKVIRTGLVNDKNVEFIIRAYQAGIGTVGLVLPEQIMAEKQKSPADRSIGRNWGVPALSDVDTVAAKAAFAPHLTALEAAGVRLAGIEVGNEFNTSAYNGDFKLPGTGRVLGLSDLNNPKDPEGAAIATGYRNYLLAVAGIKDLRDHSRLNKATPIISGGLADIGVAGTVKPGKKTDYVSVSDTLQYLRQHGLDKLVDGYGVHTYPDADPHQSPSQRASTLEERGVLSACQAGTKPCWVTEWGFSNANKSCPINDTPRGQLIESERTAFRQFAQQGRLGAILYYSWTGMPGDTENQWAVYRCGTLTQAGRWALGPM